MPLFNPQPSDGVSAWKKEAMQRAAMVDQELSVLFANDFETNVLADGTSYLSGSVSYDTGLSGGVARLRTGVTATAWTQVFNAGGAEIISSPQGQSWYVEARCLINDTPSATTRFDAVGFKDTPGSGAGQYMGFGLIGSIDTTYLSLEISGAGTTSWTSTVAADLNVLHAYGVGRRISATEDKLFAMVDGAPILEIDGPFADLTSNSCFMYSFVGTGAGAQDVQMWVDRIAACIKGEV